MYFDTVKDAPESLSFCWNTIDTTTTNTNVVRNSTLYLEIILQIQSPKNYNKNNPANRTKYMPNDHDKKLLTAIKEKKI